MRVERTRWIAIGGAAGALAGSVAAVLLLVFADQPAPYGYVLADAIGAWAGIPANDWLHRITDWGWEESERPLFLLVSLTANGALWGAGAVAVARGLARSRPFRRTVAACALITLSLAGLQWLVKLPGPMGGGSALQSVVSMAHLPGLFLLQQVGLCCGYVSSVVIRDFGGEYRPDGLAVFLLFASNWIMYVLLACAGRALGTRLMRARNRTRTAASIAPG